jgi:hypothetical protein
MATKTESLPITVRDLRNKFHDLNVFATTQLRRLSVEDSWKHAFKQHWNELFETSPSSQTTKYLFDQYREMYRRRGKSHKSAKRGGKRSESRRRMTRRSARRSAGGARRSAARTRMSRRRGGSLGGAPLNYSMAPGANVAVYGRFPTEVSTDPASIKNMDVYFNSGMSRGCGTEDSSRQVPANLGSNKVGGSRRAPRKTRRGRAHRGGSNFLGDLQSRIENAVTQTSLLRPFIPSPHPNMIQGAYEQAVGNPAAVPTYVPGIPTPSSPVHHTWSYRSHGLEGALDPSAVSPITKSISSLASGSGSMSPWTTTGVNN